MSSSISKTPPQKKGQGAPPKAYLILLVLIFAAAVTPIFIRNAQNEGVSSLFMIVFRLVLVSLLLTPLALRRYGQELARLRPRDWLWGMGSGFFLALNLICLFVALEYTSVLITSVLRRTSSLWVIGLEILFLGAVFTPRIWAGLILAFIGSLLAGFGGATAIEAGRNPLFGALVALFGAFSLSMYLLIGRKLSQRLPSLAYSWLVFSCAALVTIVFMIVSRTPVAGYSALGYFWLIVVTIVAQVVGQMAINFGLRFFQATYVSMTLLVSVAASTWLAFVIFGEIPSMLQVIGSGAIVVGVLLVSRQ